MNIQKIKELEKLIMKKRLDEVPEGWATRKQIAELRGWSVDQVDLFLDNLVKHFPNKILIKDYCVMRKDNRLQKIPHYFLK